MDVQVDYDGPSLSDTASLASLEEYKDRNRGSDEGSLAGGSYVGVDNDSKDSLRNFGREIGEIDEDAETISSRPTIAVHSTGNSGAANVSKSVAGSAASTESFSLLQRRVDAAAAAAQHSLRLPGNNSSLTLLPDPTLSPSNDPKLDLLPQISDVFERLKAAETTTSLPLSAGKGRSPGGAVGGGGGGTARWLKEQSVQMIQSVLGGLPTAPSNKSPSISDFASDPANDHLSLSSDFATEEEEGGILKVANRDSMEESDEIPGSLELELGRNGRGDYYYTYTGSVLSHSGDDHEPEQGPSKKRERQPTASTSSLTPSFNVHGDGETEYFSQQEGHDQDLKYMEYLPPSQSSDTLVGPDPSELTECSSCGIILDTFRYVCASCGPRPPRLVTIGDTEGTDENMPGKGKGKAVVPASSPSGGSPQPAGTPVPSTVSDSQPSPNFSPSSLSPLPAALSPGSNSYSPQRPIHNYMLHSPGHRHSHSHGSLFPPAPFHPPFGHPIGIGMGMGHLHPHVLPHPPYIHPPHFSFPSPALAHPHPFSAQYPPQLQVPPSPGGSTVWTTSESGVPLTTIGHTLSVPNTTIPPSSPNSTTGLLHNKPLPRLPHLNTYPPSYGVPHHSPASSISSHAPPLSSQYSPRSAQSPRQGSQQSEPSPASSVAPEGYELCTDCMETAGIEHASESVATALDPLPGHSPSVANSPYTEHSPYSMPGSYGAPSPGGVVFATSSGSNASNHSAGSGSWKRGVPRRKGQLRHAFKEKVWTPSGWIDVGAWHFVLFNASY